jgi:hypothetical protein
MYSMLGCYQDKLHPHPQNRKQLEGKFSKQPAAVAAAAATTTATAADAAAVVTTEPAMTSEVEVEAVTEPAPEEE